MTRFIFLVFGISKFFFISCVVSWDFRWFLRFLLVLIGWEICMSCEEGRYEVVGVGGGEGLGMRSVV